METLNKQVADDKKLQDGLTSKVSSLEKKLKDAGVLSLPAHHPCAAGIAAFLKWMLEEGCLGWICSSCSPGEVSCHAANLADVVRSLESMLRLFSIQPCRPNPCKAMGSSPASVLIWCI